MDDEEQEPNPPTPEERAAAEALARALDGESGAGADEGDLAAAGAIAAGAGRAPRLGDLAARTIARRAIQEGITKRLRPGRSRVALVAAGALAAVTLALGTWFVAVPRHRLPARLCSRPAGLLVPGPFPDGQSAADRLDLVTTDRMVAYRDLRAFGLDRERP